MLSHRLDNGMVLAFGTPILTGTLRDAETLLPALRSCILEREHAEAGITRSNVRGWHSEYDFFQWPQPVVQQFRGAVETMTERQTKDVPKPSEVRPDVPREIDRIVQKMGSKDPQRRYQSATEAVIALHPWLPVAQWVSLGLQNTPSAEEREARSAAKEQGLLASLLAAIRRLFGW